MTLALRIIFIAIALTLAYGIRRVAVVLLKR